MSFRNESITQAGEDIHELIQINYHLLLDIPLPEHLIASDDEKKIGNYNLILHFKTRMQLSLTCIINMNKIQI